MITVIASGWKCRIALTSVNPSPAEGRWRSQINATNVSVPRQLSASRIVDFSITPKPSRLRAPQRALGSEDSICTRRTLEGVKAWSACGRGIDRERVTMIGLQVLGQYLEHRFLLTGTLFRIEQFWTELCLCIEQLRLDLVESLG